VPSRLHVGARGTDQNRLRKHGRYVGKDGITLPVQKLTWDHAAAIQEYTVEHYVEGHGDGSKTVKKVKIKLADELAALVDLGRHHKLFTDKREVSVNGPPEGRITIES
jgi:hypothetical protein